ncbi:hypothetical protein HG531_013270 [Fusarium graminearum]|nr:hypothetical protein HG531_013270 [Fusarium graminearum]
MEQKGVSKSRGVDAKEKDVDHNVSSTKEGGRIVLVLFRVKQTTIVDSPGDIVQLAPAIIDTVAVDGKVPSVVDVGVPESKNHPHGDEGANESVESTEEWNHERIGRIPQKDVPIPGREWVDAKTVVETSNGVEIAVVGVNPGHPAKVGERGPDVVGEPEPHEHGTKHDIEKLDTRNAPDLGKGSLYRRVVVSVESRVERNGDQGSGPNAVRRVNEESTADTSHSVADKVGAQRNQNLVGKVGSIWLVEVLWEVLNPDDQVGVRGVVRNVGHDGNKHMLLLGKGTWVERMAHSKESDAIVRKPPFATFTNRV